MKYDMRCKVFCFAFSKLLKEYYQNEEPETDVALILKAVKEEYKAMILRTPALSKDNLMASNLQGAAYFFAMAKKIPDMTPEKMDHLILVSMQSDFMKNMKKKERESGKMFTEKEQEKMYRDSLRSQKSEDEMDWRFTYEKGNNEVKYTMTKCGVCRLAERENCMEYLPCMCGMDYPKYALVGARLERTKTLAKHDECCDFHLIRMTEEEMKEKNL